MKTISNLSHKNILVFLNVMTMMLGLSTPAYSLFLDGNGHYALRGETRTDDSYQAIDQSFRLEGEARFNESSSFYLELRLFDSMRQANLGDTPDPEICQRRPAENSSNAQYDENCEGRHQDSDQPRYAPYMPKVTKAYARYATDYCLLEMGRRGRDWGLGILLDSGEQPFDQSASVYDGISCEVNIQKAQTLGFSFGYDKLQETGEYVDNPSDRPDGGGDPDFNNRSQKFGANRKGDDLDQYFFTIQLDDSRVNAGGSFTKKIGIYFANVVGSSVKDGGSSTDIKYLDLFTAFNLSNFTFKNELLLRMGKSADPNWFLMGGKALNDDGTPTVNRVQSSALAGSFEVTLAKSGNAIGPERFKQGDQSRHLLFLDYAYAPGDSDGYYRGSDTNLGEGKRDGKVAAVAFHRNYKPALLLFNGRPYADNSRVDGAFDPNRFVNATLFGSGYRFESLESGSFEGKILTASLNKEIPSDAKALYEAQDTKPIGYYGSSLGFELDLKYVMPLGPEADLGFGAGYLFAGDAWKTRDGQTPSNNFLIQSTIALKF